MLKHIMNLRIYTHIHIFHNGTYEYLWIYAFHKLELIQWIDLGGKQNIKYKFKKIWKRYSRYLQVVDRYIWKGSEKLSKKGNPKSFWALNETTWEGTNPWCRMWLSPFHRVTEPERSKRKKMDGAREEDAGGLGSTRRKALCRFSETKARGMVRAGIVRPMPSWAGE